MKKFLKKSFLIVVFVLTAFPADAEDFNASVREKKTGVFAETFYNKTDRETQALQKGFNSTTKGFIGGLNVLSSEKTAIGTAYTFSKTDIEESFGKKTNMDMHTVSVFGAYQPSDLFFTGAFSFGWGDMKDENGEDETDVKIAVTQVMSGYQFENSSPLYGIRYVHAEDERNTDILTGIIAMRAGKKYALSENWSWRPEFFMGVTYDFIADNDTIAVLLPNGAGYTIDSKRLNRLGCEMKLGLSLQAGEAFKMGLEYIGSAKTDYQNHSFMIRGVVRF